MKECFEKTFTNFEKNNFFSFLMKNKGCKDILQTLRQKRGTKRIKNEFCCFRPGFKKTLNTLSKIGQDKFFRKHLKFLKKDLF